MKPQNRTIPAPPRPTEKRASGVSRPVMPARWWAIALLLLATVLAYSSALRAPFVYDDVQDIVNNTTIHSFWPPTAALKPPPNGATSGRPVANLTLALNYAINRQLDVDPDGPDKTTGYHIFNLLVHLLAGVLLFAVIRRTLRMTSIADEWAAAADPIAFAVSAIWILHPLQSEALIYIVQRTELMASACYLGTLYASIRAWSAKNSLTRYAWYAAGVLICLTGMGSKEIMISAPLMVLLYDRAFVVSSWRELFRPRNGRGIFYLLLAATTIVVVSSVWTGVRSGTAGFNEGISSLDYLRFQGWAIGHYLRMIFWPSALTVDYGYRIIPGVSALPGLILLIAAGAATVAAWTTNTRWMKFGFLSACFFLILAPSSSFLPIVTEVAAERRMYLPMAMVLIALVIGAEALRRQVAPSLPGARLVWAATAIAALFGVATFMRGQVYNNPESLWRDAIAKITSNARAYENLAMVLANQKPKRLAEAESLLRQAIVVDSNYIPSWVDLADIRADQGRRDEALALFLHVQDRQPNNWVANQHLGLMLLNGGEPDKALQYIERAAQLNPTEDAFMLVGSTYLAIGKPEAAVDPLMSALAFNPERLSTIGMLGSALTESGRPSEAQPLLQKLTKMAPNAGLAFAVLGLNQAQLGKKREAADAVKTAISKADGDPQVHLDAGRALMQLQDAAGAKQQFAQAVQIDPTDADALTWLGMADAALGRDVDATQSFQRALAIDPNFEPALKAMARARRY